MSNRLQAAQGATDLDPLRPTGKESGQPRGREEVRRALLRAAARLFAERGSAGTSVRQIAAEARVNPALIFRHFGSKEGLFREVLLQEGQAVAASMQGEGWARAVPDMSDERMANGLRILLRRILEDPSEGGGAPRAYPAIEQLAASIEAAASDGRLDPAFNPKLFAAVIASANVGWSLMRETLVKGLVLDDRDPADLERGYRATVIHVLNTFAPEAGASTAAIPG
ncbi:MAG: helix-turn-helix domain-containing protein [Deltaproteobacteria bacterium]